VRTDINDLYMADYYRKDASHNALMKCNCM